ncbi:MAG: maleylpyruvate isomerase N-terminal domain-containing protein [Vicinamibacteria bacterium]
MDDAVFLGPLGRWSARDVVAHVVGWNRYTIEGAKQIAKGELPFYDVDPGEDFSNVNRAHVRDYPARDRALLLEELWKSARELSDFLRSLDAEVFRRDHGVRHRG